MEETIIHQPSCEIKTGKTKKKFNIEYHFKLKESLLKILEKDTAKSDGKCGYFRGFEDTQSLMRACIRAMYIKEDKYNNQNKEGTDEGVQLIPNDDKDCIWKLAGFAHFGISVGVDKAHKRVNRVFLLIKVMEASWKEIRDDYGTLEVHALISTIHPTQCYCKDHTMEDCENCHRPIRIVLDDDVKTACKLVCLSCHKYEQMPCGKTDEKSLKQLIKIADEKSRNEYGNGVSSKESSYEERRSRNPSISYRPHRNKRSHSRERRRRTRSRSSRSRWRDLEQRISNIEKDLRKIKRDRRRN